MSAPLLEIPRGLWERLLVHLRRQGAGVRESGAFLLGQEIGTTSTVMRFLPYEKLQEDALHDDYVSLSAESFAKLWELCDRDGLRVLADVHTHRFGAGQSRSDQENPMIAMTGHIALIVPHFAQRPVGLLGVGLYVYRGSHRWSKYSGSDIARLIRFTEQGGDP